MRERDISFDGIRAAAMCGILACHICCGIDGAQIFAVCFAETFNYTFFALSALLFGMSFHVGVDRGWRPLPFMWKRITRLGASCWPVVIAMFVLFSITGIGFSKKDVVMNICFLSWFAEMPSLGHLWFLTMIVMCYALFLALSHLRRKPRLWEWAAGFVACSALHYAMESKGYIFLILFFSAALFTYSREFMSWAKKVDLRLLTIGTLAANGIATFLFCKDILLLESFATEHVAAVCGLLILAWLYRIFSYCQPCRLITFLSGISFEIYLIHAPLCFGLFSVYTWFSGISLAKGILLIIASSIALAVVLKQISKRLMPILCYKPHI